MELDFPVCATCAVQYRPEQVASRAGRCLVCDDERQYVGADGQQWTSLRELRDGGLRGFVREEVPGLWGVGTEPDLAIGQRSLLIPGEGGTLLWDATGYLDDQTVARVRELGGIDAIALSHPHYYSAMSEWSEAFDGVPVWVHADDERWLGRRDHVRLWEGQTFEVLPGRTLLNARVHFGGGTVLHWPGVDGTGALAASDIFTVVSDRRFVSFMYSYPNLVPEHPDVIARALDLACRFDFTALYGAWWGRVVSGDAKDAVIRSAHRYFDHLGIDTSSLPPAPEPLSFGSADGVTEPVR